MTRYAREIVDIRSSARVYTDSCLRTLAGIVAKGASEAARVAAATELLNRGWGKAAQTHAMVEGGGGIEVIVRHIVQGGAPDPKVIDGVASPVLPQNGHDRTER